MCGLRRLKGQLVKERQDARDSNLQSLKVQGEIKIAICKNYCCNKKLFEGSDTFILRMFLFLLVERLKRMTAGWSSSSVSLGATCEHKEFNKPQSLYKVSRQLTVHRAVSALIDQLFSCLGPLGHAA